MDDAMIAQALRHLTDLGIDVLPDRSHEHLTLSRGQSSATFELADVSDLRNWLMHRDTFTENEASRFLALTDHIHPRTADLLRHSGVAYADAAGNASLRFGDVLVEVRGRQRSGGSLQHMREPANPRVQNLFTLGRSQVTCALLAWPRLWHAPTRELAAASGVSVGTAHETRRALTALGYDDYAAIGNHRLLDLWAAAFPGGLGRHLVLAELNGDIERPLDGAGQEIYLGGESAISDLLRPATLTVYVTDLSPQVMLANRWRANGPRNVVVRRAFWHDPEQPSSGHTAPWPLIYADLFTSSDPRLRDAADQWRRTFV